MTNRDGGIVAEYQYDAWGNLINPLPSMGNPFTYAGYMYDSEVKLYYLMARYYSPVHGVFLSKDPDTGDDDDPITQNGYSYTNNCPVMLIDFDGKKGSKPSYLDSGVGRGYGYSEEPQPRGKSSINKYKVKMPPKIKRIISLLKKWLGPGARLIINGNGDIVVISADGNRRVRFDIKHPHPHQSPHGHVEQRINGKWRDKSGQLYPKDVPHK